MIKFIFYKIQKVKNNSKFKKILNGVIKILIFTSLNKIYFDYVNKSL
jgi:hypothetical protein